VVKDKSGDEPTVAFAENALTVMESLGETIVDTDTGDVFECNDDEFTALLYEFRAQIADYLATLTHTDMHTLADLIAFNQAHRTQEMPYYGQEVFELSEQTSGYPTNPEYVQARTHARNTARSGIDDALAADDLDAIVAPRLTNSTGPPWRVIRTCRFPSGFATREGPQGCSCTARSCMNRN